MATGRKRDAAASPPPSPAVSVRPAGVSRPTRLTLQEESDLGTRLARLVDDPDVMDAVEYISDRILRDLGAAEINSARAAELHAEFKALDRLRSRLRWLVANGKIATEKLSNS